MSFYSESKTSQKSFENGKLVDSSEEVVVNDSLSNNNEKSLFLLPPSKVLTETFFNDFNLFSLILMSFKIIEVLFSL